MFEEIENRKDRRKVKKAYRKYQRARARVYKPSPLYVLDSWIIGFISLIKK